MMDIPSIDELRLPIADFVTSITRTDGRESGKS
jgi:hypothetical protein